MELNTDRKARFSDRSCHSKEFDRRGSKRRSDTETSGKDARLHE
jgi:hypothetical protein